MRDRIKTTEYFDRQIINIKNSINQKLHWIETGETLIENINSSKRFIVWDYIRIINCKYSLGINPVELYSDLLNAINTTYESWDGFWKLYYKGKFLNQLVLDAYDQMLWMLSLGYLLDIPKEEFEKLIDVIDGHNVKDFLFEFIIRAKIKDRQPIKEESYEYGWILFGKLRRAITETNKIKAAQLVKEFVTKDWYKEHKNTGWYNSHRGTHDGYYGYWSFETAAVVKIMGLDDSGFRDCQYYPKDLVNV
jgi:hypothetical protein